MTTFAERLKYALVTKGIKKSTLAYRINVDSSYISNYISGRYNPSPEKIRAMAKVLNVSEAWLGGYSTEVGEDFDNPNKALKIPVLGYVAAGVPIEAISEVLDYEDISPDMVRDGSEYFALKLKGSSMEPKMSDGDVVIVRKQDTIDNGQIAIVCVNGDDATCKKIMLQESGMLLQPLNPSYAPVFYSTEQISSIPITIIGRVVELRAKY